MTSMVVAPIPSCSDTDSKFVKEFWLKLNLIQDDEEQHLIHTHQSESTPVVIVDDEEELLEVEESQNPDGDEGELELEDDDEFSFSGAFGDGDIITADEAFLNGQIRPVFPLFNRDLLLGEELVEKLPEEGLYCEWRGKTESSAAEAGSSPGFVSKKSNSTGFSKLRRFRELVLRSNSDGKDKFVFLHHHQSSSKGNPASAAGESNKSSTTPAKKSAAKVAMKKKGETTTTSTSSAFEKMYARRKKEEGSKQRVSYLPYKQVGFFASVNGLSKNVHPY
ncbi:hypothetical protein LINGRAHAP2_LOCUS33895 [Linum grandiflorum]